ncbi:Hypothetical protein AJAP_28135 [Amycolatopsis japonica]|uniref:Major tail protein n=1 Tax=Amycolatopsis japonica TaxID=208439 RepID=A0A075V6B6_9PSEU|nr:hypothetical protein [Amycolatopsis japonica]AIG78465.1 Hypothetical protein AJAP_28135 [Amycolatopsis japonica]
MALNNEAVLTASKGYILTGAVNATEPTPAQIKAFSETTPPSGLTLLGHTSREDLPEFGFDGGDTETRGTWQNEALKEVVTDPAVEYVTFNLLQFDEEGLSLYYSRANTDTGNGVYRASPNTKPNERSLLIVVVDGGHKVGFFAPKVSIRREDAISLEVDNFGALPLRATILSPGAGAEPFAWIDEDVINPAVTP